MTADITTTDMTVGEVKSAVMKLGLLRVGIEGQFAKYVEVVSNLYQRRAWIAAELPSWEAFAEHHDIPVSLPREERQAMSVALSATGMSTRAIAVTQGVSQPQTVKDIASAMYKLEKAVATVTNLAADDRFDRNIPNIEHHWNRLRQLDDDLTDVSARINPLYRRASTVNTDTAEAIDT